MVILIVILFVIVVLKKFTGGPMMCDGWLLVSRCYRVCVYECGVWKCDPPIVDCHRASVTTTARRCHTQHRGGPKTTTKALQTVLNDKKNE